MPSDLELPKLSHWPLHVCWLESGDQATHTTMLWARDCFLVSCVEEGLLVTEVLATHHQWILIRAAAGIKPSSETIADVHIESVQLWDYTSQELIEPLAVLNGVRLHATSTDPRAPGEDTSII